MDNEEGSSSRFLGSSQDWIFSMSQSPNHTPRIGSFDSLHNQASLETPMRSEGHAGPGEGLLTRVRLSWTRGGSHVAVTGSWDGWATREWLCRSGDGFFVVKALPPSEYRYLFIVDGHVRCAPDSPWVCDASGSAYNVLDLQERVSELPLHLSEFETPPSPPSSYDNPPLTEDDFSKHPPDTPPQLQASFLNEPSTSHQPPLPELQHLNHLYIQNHEESRFMALGSTRRFHQKYVTMVLYKPLR